MLKVGFCATQTRSLKPTFVVDNNECFVRGQGGSNLVNERQIAPGDGEAANFCRLEVSGDDFIQLCDASIFDIICLLVTCAEAIEDLQRLSILGWRGFWNVMA